MTASLRDSNIERLDDGVFDVLVIGAGINGAVAAASLAGRGVRVALIDRGDFAGGVSSNSSNLAWGGIKYLESGELLRTMEGHTSDVTSVSFSADSQFVVSADCESRSALETG